MCSALTKAYLESGNKRQSYSEKILAGVLEAVFEVQSREMRQNCPSSGDPKTLKGTCAVMEAGEKREVGETGVLKSSQGLGLETSLTLQRWGSKEWNPGPSIAW